MDRFPTTRMSAVQAVRSDDRAVRERALETLAAAYWRPVQAYVRLRWGRGPADAEDLTQAFFLRVVEKDFFARFDPKRARFRTFLRVCLDGFLANEAKAAGRAKRGGEISHVALNAEALEVPSPETMERAFETEWIRSVFEMGLERLRAACQAPGKLPAWEVFAAHDLHEGESARPSYGELARRTGLPLTQVNNNLAWARREFRRGVLDVLREITASDEEFRAEARVLLGTDATR
ncbi:MAG TPA: sigma-70 family RNA polymerase sigma factor [Candidatus Polarisedimenticolaceae bacterium]|nr:sigma-70 family RNA polymerase sigma factor [Candidatus Polarisedimenticolaceae bacterium]